MNENVEFDWILFIFEYFIIYYEFYIYEIFLGERFIGVKVNLWKFCVCMFSWEGNMILSKII